MNPWETWRQTVRSAARIETRAWKDNSDWTRHVLVTRRGVHLWHKVYTEEAIIQAPAHVLEREVDEQVEIAMEPVSDFFADYLAT